MSKIIAIDYGTKRVGLAVSDDNQIIAFGLTTVHSSEVISYLKKYLSENSVKTIVIGDPKNLDNTPSQSAEGINNFVKHLKKVFPNIELERLDERFTSKIAFRTMIDAGLKKKQRRDKGLIDKVSATIILQDYLEQLPKN